MSAILNPTPNRVPVPQPAPTPVAPPPKPSRRWLWGLLLVVAAGAWAVYEYATPRLTTGTGAAGPRLVKVDPSPLQRVIRVAGETGAVNFANVTAPNLTGPDSGRALIITTLAESGSRARQGELIADIDAQSLKDHVEEVHSTVVQSNSDIKKRQAEQMIEIENLRQTIRVAKAEWDKLRLEAQASELRTEIDQELLKLGAEEAEAQYHQLVKDLATKEALHKAEVRILEITTIRHEKHRDRHAADFEKFKVHAPMSGLVVRQQIRRGFELAEVKLGDQISPRQTFMKIVDPSNMELDAWVNQSQSSLIRIGQKATVGLDAFPDLRLEGEVHSIGALAQAGGNANDYIRRIPIRIQIKGSHPQLIPSLSAWADIEVDSREQALALPLEALHENGERTFVYVSRGNRFERREVRPGFRTFTHAAIESGLEPGEQVLLGEPPATPGTT